VGTVKSRIFRARQCLTQEIETISKIKAKH